MTGNYFSDLANLSLKELMDHYTEALVSIIDRISPRVIKVRPTCATKHVHCNLDSLPNIATAVN